MSACLRVCVSACLRGRLFDPWAGWADEDRSLTRIRDTRSPALQEVGNKLRFLMSAYSDLSTEAKESARPETRAMRSQLAAWQSVLRQPPGRPLALEHAVVLLFAVSQGCD